MPIIPSVPFCEEMPSHFKLGETKAEIKLNNIEENRNAALSLSEQARYGINIFTQDMDNAVYDNDEFEKYIFNLATCHPSAQIRILVQDSTIAVKKGHCLIRIAQKLTSSVFIKNPPKIHKNDKSSFMTVDGVGMLYSVRSDKYNYEASVNFMSPQRATKLNDFFNEAWDHGLPDQQVRRLFV
ncbi:MAG: hypothetical protein KAJ92_02195 [Gammaproteobacteria bacterium]|nr:hypothetical protein [Gammaproteobacteria bacterium]MCK5262461.1 hypothetical protein [Gammaproteobacteria bacterium]